MEEIDIIAPEETELQKKIRKFSRYGIGIFLLLLMIGFLIPPDIAGSLIEGNKLSNYQIKANNRTILFEPSVYSDLKEYYLNNQLTEISFCLLGEIKENNYIVTSFYIPKVIFKTPISITSITCNKETIITMHTHPFNNCLLSQQDIVSYNYYKKSNPKAITAVMCGLDRFAFYGN